MRNPTVSVVLPAYNSEAFVRSTIESVLKQTFRDFELIVIDDGSVDDTARIMSSYGDQLRYILKKNGGQSSARNVGIKMARGEYIAFIDHDDIWFDNKLELQLKEMAFSESVGMVTCGAITFTDNEELGSETPKVNDLGRDAVLNKLLIGNFLGSCSKALVKRKCFQEVGLFDESLKMAEDWDMWFRIAKCYDIRSIELPLIKYRIHPMNFSYLNGEINLSNEIRFLTRVFAEPSFRRKFRVKHHAFSRRYVSAAWTLKNACQNKNIGCYLTKAFHCYPPVVFNKAFIGLWVYWMRIRFRESREKFQCLKSEEKR